MTILVAGSAHLDILARAKHRDDVIDRVGEVSIEVGGTACNIAVNLAHSGAQVHFLSAMNDSPYSQVITDYLSSHGIEPYIDYRKDLPTGGFSAHIDTRGEMISAVSATPVEQVNFDEQQAARAMSGARAVFVDCNLSPRAINRLVIMANDRKIPVYVAAVSEEKSLRIAAVSGRVKGIFLNRREYELFCRHVLTAHMSPADAARALPAILIVTEGETGSVIAFPDGSSYHIPPPEVESGGSRLGMGDALAAGTVALHEIYGLPIVEAAARSLNLAACVGERIHCHHGKHGALEEALAHFRHDAGHDAMTGALNRHSTERELSKILDRRRKENGSTVAVLMLDIDYFKSVNDTFGHAKGDEVILNVARVTQECLRESDFLGRWGGEEFIAVLPGATREDAIRIAERIRVTVETQIRSPRPITVSIGCADAAVPCSEDLRGFVDRADKALYEAKRGGRNRVASAGEAMCA